MNDQILTEEVFETIDKDNVHFARKSIVRACAYCLKRSNTITN